VQNPEPFFAAVAALRLEGSVRQVIHGLKYRGQLKAVPWLSATLEQAVQQRGLPLPDLILPMPTGRLRLWRRGYNPAVELAKPLSRALAIPLTVQAVERVHTAKDQIGQTRKQRQQAIAGAFRVQGNALRGKHLAVVDDVMTTGASVAELSRTALAAGATQVQVWAVARTP
jgi:ComF family protein